MATIVTFDDLKANTTLDSQYRARGVEFNSVAVVSYPANFAHSGVQGIEQCYGAEFCSTPFILTFTQPVSSLRVWVGYSSRQTSRSTARLRAFDSAGSLVAQTTVVLPASDAPIPVQRQLSVTTGAASIQRATVQFDGAGVLMNGLVLDDLEFESQPPPSPVITPPPVPRLPDLAIGSVRTFVTGADVTINAQVANRGTRGSNPTTVEARSSAWGTSTSALKSLAPSESLWVAFSLRGLPSGTHEFTVRVDPRSAIREPDENNNTRASQVTIAGPTPPSPPPPPSPGGVVVPGVVGRTEARARRILRGTRLVSKVLRHAIGTTVDVVDEQHPDSGATVPRGSAVRLVLRSLVEVPDVRGAALDEARPMLAARGLGTGALRRHWVVGIWSAKVARQFPGPAILVPLHTDVDLDVEDPAGTFAVAGATAIGAGAEALRRLRRRNHRLSGERPRWEPRVDPGVIAIHWKTSPTGPLVEIQVVPDIGIQTLEPDGSSSGA